MSSSSSNVCTILDIPDEILVKIISYFNTRKRLPLANSCTRFNALIFGDKKLSRELDFSKKGRLTTADDIQQYFSNEKTLNLVRKVNIENVNCMRPGKMLNNSIGKAINLVDINIHGTEFKDIEQLASFLEPLTHVKMLSLDWPKSLENNVKACKKLFKKPLGRLKYFSVKVYVYSIEFLPIVKLCQKVEELRIVTTESRPHMRRMSWDLEPNKLRNLRIVQVRGWQAMQMKKHLVNILPDLEEWTDFQLTDISREPGFYLEKNVKVCEELWDSKLRKGIPYQRENPTCDMGWFLISEYLLREVIKITHENLPQRFCCLTPTLAPLEQDKEPCLLKIDEAKRLLEDPRYQISFLYFKHSIESDCDAHLLASAFPNLTELVLCHIINTKDTVSNSRKKKNFKRRLRGRDSTLFEEQDDPNNIDSSFKMLVENTPHLRELTIYAENDWTEELGRWDLAALWLIPKWKNLRTLRLALIPITDSKFLIEIGRECPMLEKLVFYYLGNGDPDSCYAIYLSQMLRQCKNLREFSLQDRYVENIPEILASISGNSRLRRLSLISSDEMCEFYKLEDLISSVEELLEFCPKLDTFVFIIRQLNREDINELASALQRIRKELKRSTLQFQITTGNSSRDGGSRPSNFETVHEDASASFFPCKFDGFEIR